MFLTPCHCITQHKKVHGAVHNLETRQGSNLLTKRSGHLPYIDIYIYYNGCCSYIVLYYYELKFTHFHEEICQFMGFRLKSTLTLHRCFPVCRTIGYRWRTFTIVVFVWKMLVTENSGPHDFKIRKTSYFMFDIFMMLAVATRLLLAKHSLHGNCGSISNISYTIKLLAECSNKYMSVC